MGRLPHSLMAFAAVLFLGCGEKPPPKTRPPPLVVAAPVTVMDVPGHSGQSLFEAMIA
jgi:hypothetical protein